MALDPLTACQGAHEGPIDPPGVTVVDILHTGVEAQLGGLEQAREPAVVAVEDLLIEQQAEALLERQFFDGGLSQLLLEGRGHAGESQRMEFFQGVLMQHDVFLLT